MGWLYIQYQNGPGFCALHLTASSIIIGNTWAFEWLAQIDYRSRIQRPTQTDLHWIQRQAYANCGEIKRNVSFAAQTIITERTKNILHSHAFDQLEHVLPDPKSGSSPLTSKDAPAAHTFFWNFCTRLACLPVNASDLVASLILLAYMQAIDSTYAIPHMLPAIMWPVLSRQRMILEHPLRIA